MKRVSDARPGESSDASSQNKVTKHGGPPWEKRAGMLLEVNLRNFMCHEKYHFEPNQRLNFLTGENGSGKSAVLTAIVFGLGGSARMSNRGSSNKAFIRTGQSSAQVEIRLLNVGENAYRPGVYGESIIVQRVVTQSTSTYKIKDHNGKIVVEKKVKEELDRILLVFNIQVDNPIAVLNQDTAKTFLFKCEPDKLYTFFMRATQLEDCKADYNAAAEENSCASALLADKINSLPELKSECEKWAKKYEFHQNLATKKEDIKKRKAEVAWVAVRDAEEELEAENGKIELVNKKMPKCDMEIEKCAQKEKDARDKKKIIETELQAMSTEIESDNSKLDDLKADYTSKREEEKKKRQLVAELGRKVKKYEGEAEQYEGEIDRLRATGYSDYEEKHNQRQGQMKLLEDEKEALEAQMTTTTNHANHLRENKNQSEERATDKRNELNAHRNLANKSRDELEAIQKGGDRLSVFGAWMPKLVRDIKKNKRFKTAPIGPVGAYINLKQNTRKEVALQVEGELGGIVYSFLVETAQDQKELYAMFERLRIPFKPNIFTCQYSTVKYDISQGRVQSADHLAVIDYFEIESPTVFNRIVDSVGADRILIINDNDEAQNLLKNRATVPRNLMHVITGAGYQYYPAPNFRSYHKDTNARGVLKSSLAEIIAELEAKLEEDKAVVLDLERQFAEKTEEQHRHQKIIDEEERKVKAIQGRIREKNMLLVNLKNKDQDEAPPDISALEDDLDNVRKNLEKSREAMNKASDALRVLAEVTAESKQTLARADEEVSGRRECIEPLDQELSSVEVGIKKARKDKDHYTVKKNEYKLKIAALEKETAVKQAKVVNAIGRAKDWSEERVTSRKKIEYLTKELSRMEESLKAQERTQESIEFVTQKFEKLQYSYERSKAQIRYMDKAIGFLADMLRIRGEGYQFILRSTTRQLNYRFTSLLDSRKFIGRLNFDNENLTLEIIVNTAGDPGQSQRKLATLSGGEKSFSSVSLVLALWDAMTPPFRILDEFDVFMDAVNRRTSLKLITDYANKDRKYQFVFLTPLNTDNIDVGDDLKIIKLRKAGTDH